MPKYGMNIDTFRSRFETGARTYLFYMQPVFPDRVASIIPQTDAVYLVKSTSLPTSSFDELVASWQGFDYKAAGKRTYDTWTVTFNVDWQARIRRVFTAWMDLILNPLDNVPTLPTVYMRNQSVELLSVKDFETVMRYDLISAYPSQVGEVTLDYADSAYASFDVTFTYMYYQTDNVAGVSTGVSTVSSVQ